MDRRPLLAQYLQDHHVMTIATHGPQGPWAAAVYYAHEAADFYFVSAPGTRHALDMTGPSGVAATIHDDCASWAEIRGVQLSGSVELLEGERQARARAVYDCKFPGILAGRTSPKIAAALQKTCWYRLSAERIRFIDNSVAFGHRDEWQGREMPA